MFHEASILMKISNLGNYNWMLAGGEGWGGGGFEWNSSSAFSYRVNPEFLGAAHCFFLLFSTNIKTYSHPFLAQRFEREKTSQCRDSCQLTRFLSLAPFPAYPSPPFTLSWILRLIWKHKQGPCSSPCLGKIIGMTPLCRNVPNFCQ